MTRVQCSLVRSWNFRICVCCLLAAAACAQDTSTLFRQAQSREQAGDLKAAERLYMAVLRADPGSAEAAANLGVVLARQQKYADAIQHYLKALALKPSLVALHINVGLALLKSGQPQRAIGEFQAYLTTYPDDRRARQLLANALLESDEYHDAARTFEALLPGDASVHLGLGAAYARIGKRAEAEQQFALALADGDTAAVQLAIGQAYLGINDFERAGTALHRALALDARTPGLHFALGSSHWKQQRIREAISEWRTELDLDPNSFEANFALGAALVEKKDDMEGEQRLRRAMALRPDHGPTLYYLGRVLWKRNDVRGLRLLEKSVKLDAGNRAAHYLLARAYKRRGDEQAAARHFAIVENLGRMQVEQDIDIVQSATK